MSGIFITGTGTEIGKSSLCLALILWARARNLSIAYFKPIQCGRRKCSDGRSLLESQWISSRCPFPLEVYSLYNFLEPVSPHLAASRQGVIVDPGLINTEYTKIAQCHDLTIVEGAGGVAVPLTSDGCTMGNLIKQMSIPAIIASSPCLGTLSHTLTAHCYLKSLGIKSSAYVMCHINEQIPDIFSDNVSTITAYTGMPYLGQINYLENIDDASALTNKDASVLIDGLVPTLNEWAGFVL